METENKRYIVWNYIKKNETKNNTAIARLIQTEQPKLFFNWDLDSVRKYVSKTKQHMSIPKKRPTVLYFDIETTDLSAGFGIMLMFAYRYHDGDGTIKGKTILDYPDSLNLPPEKADLYLLQDLAKLVNESDIIVAHFGSKFDLRFLQTRLLIHELRVANVQWNKIFDTCITARKNCRFGGNTLKNLAISLGLSNFKHELERKYWFRSKCIGDSKWFKEAMDKMKSYCMQDVRVLYDVAQILRPLAKHLPSYQAITGEERMICPSCGSDKYICKGTDPKKSTAYDQYQCTDCGNWFRGTVNLRSIPKEEKVIY